MIKKIIQFTIIPIFLSACLNNVKDTGNPDLSKAVIEVSPKNINLVVDTNSINVGKAEEIITITNVGRQPATGLEIKDFKDESAPLIKTTTCNKDLAAGGSCELKVRLVTSHKFASSGAISRSTLMKYEYNNGGEKKSDTIRVNFKAEKWIASIFLTDTTTNGHIQYQLPDDSTLIRTISDAADYYCKVDKNNPHNGYFYRALIYDTTNRAPYLQWVLYGGQTYFSVMPNVYHQKVWRTSYTQATTNNILSQVFNCIGSNCQSKSGDDEAWIGLSLNSDLMDMETCGTAGNAWKSDSNKFWGTTIRLKSDQKNHAATVVNDKSSCNLNKKIICVSL